MSVVWYGNFDIEIFGCYLWWVKWFVGVVDFGVVMLFIDGMSVVVIMNVGMIIWKVFVYVIVDVFG